MYSEIDVLSLAESAARLTVTKARQKYIPFYAAAERYVHRRRMVVGGGIGLRLLLGTPVDITDVKYVFYSDSALADARGLTEALYQVAPDGLGQYTNMRTIVPRKEFVVSVNERPIFSVIAFAITRGARSANIIRPVKRPAPFAKTEKGGPVELLCMGPEIQLIEVYKNLTNPARSGDWPQLLRAEVTLRGLFLEAVRKNVQKMVEGGAPPEYEPAESLFPDEHHHSLCSPGGVKQPPAGA